MNIHFVGTKAMSGMGVKRIFAVSVGRVCKIVVKVKSLDCKSWDKFWMQFCLQL